MVGQVVRRMAPKDDRQDAGPTQDALPTNNPFFQGGWNDAPRSNDTFRRRVGYRWRIEHRLVAYASQKRNSPHSRDGTALQYTPHPLGDPFRR